MELQSAGRKYPSTSGQKRSVCGFNDASRISWADFARKASKEEVPNADSANLTPALSASSRDFDTWFPQHAPLSPIARRNSPLARGEATRALTDMEPADSPKTVTLCGSPPNAAMFFLTHSSAAT